MDGLDLVVVKDGVVKNAVTAVAVVNRVVNEIVSCIFMIAFLDVLVFSDERQCWIFVTRLLFLVSLLGLDTTYDIQ